MHYIEHALAFFSELQRKKPFVDQVAGFSLAAHQLEILTRTDGHPGCSAWRPDSRRAQVPREAHQVCLLGVEPVWSRAGLARVHPTDLDVLDVVGPRLAGSP
ncbi:MAG: hypothetical protein V9E94_04130 [Microthrixaceae bacterium]